MARQFREQLEEEVQLEQARKAQAPTTPAPAAPPVAAAASEAPIAPADTFSHAHPTDATAPTQSADERRT